MPSPCSHPSFEVNTIVSVFCSGGQGINLSGFCTLSCHKPHMRHLLSSQVWSIMKWYSLPWFGFIYLVTVCGKGSRRVCRWLTSIMVMAPSKNVMAKTNSQQFLFMHNTKDCKTKECNVGIEPLGTNYCSWCSITFWKEMWCVRSYDGHCHARKWYHRWYYRQSELLFRINGVSDIV